MAYEVDRLVVNRWVARLVPATLIGVVGYTTYVLVVRLCVHHLLRDNNPRQGAAIAILIIYFLLFFMIATTYFRTLYIVNFDPGYIALGAAALKTPEPQTRRPRRSKRGSDNISGPEYASSVPGDGANSNPDSPGLEKFYTKDVFICEPDGRPRWCHRCANWKPDRTHHCSDAGRCVRKMDHFCPWVGGVVGETSFKFFIQFVTYTSIYCFFLVIVMAVFVREQIVSQPRVKLDPNFVAILALGGFFGSFTGGMIFTSTHSALFNTTTVEDMNKYTKVYQMACIIPDPLNRPPPGTLGLADWATNYPTVTYPLPITPERSDVTAGQLDRLSDKPSQTNSSNSSPNPQNQRDLRATRTFAILRLNPGENPWDLGASRNWKSVMGDNILDWFLPIRRSPCSNHESPESQFELGRWAERLRADHGLLPESGVRSPLPRASHRQERIAREKAKDVEMQNVDTQVPSGGEHPNPTPAGQHTI